MTKPKSNPHGFPTGRGWASFEDSVVYSNWSGTWLFRCWMISPRCRQIETFGTVVLRRSNKRDLAALKDAIAWVEGKT